MTLYEAENAARRLAESKGVAVAIYRMTREDEYGVRPYSAPGRELLKIARTVHPRRIPSDAPLRVSLDDDAGTV